MTSKDAGSTSESIKIGVLYSRSGVTAFFGRV
jgi:branched-chain amino acid transport system substrate-binding protein